MTQLTPQIALVDDTHSIDPAELAKVAAALTAQIADDVAGYWHRHAAVTTAKPSPATWQVHVTNKMDEPGALGYHTNDSHNQPVAYVLHDDGWTVTTSHEVLEMLVDPFGSYLHSARIPENVADRWRDLGLPHASTHVHYLVELCDPCERTTYQIGGVDVSDFLLPPYYRTNPAAGAAYSFQRALGRPREVADGGYVSFGRNDGEWFQVFVDGDQAELQDIGQFDKAKFSSLREFTDFKAREFRSA